MTSHDLLASRIDRLESRFAIAELVTDYAVACDEHDMGKLMGLFTEDAAFDSPSGAMVANGRAAIEAMFIELFKVRGPAFHWTHDHTVTFDASSADRAHGVVLAHAETCPSDVASLAAMRYHDDYRREGGRWYIARREIRFLYYVPVSEYPSALKTRNRLTMRGERLPADYPEALPVWQAFDATHKVGGR
jgi:ketosteroid isomerase-like protein